MGRLVAHPTQWVCVCECIKMLVDQAVIIVRSGKGGDGHVSFRRQKYIPKGGPDGGDGGNGGSVYLVATAGVDTLLDLSGRHHWYAQDGQPGGAKQCSGRKGDDLEIKIPPGTIVYDADTDQRMEDLATPGQRIMITKGGRGGYGNEHFKSATNQAPLESTPGEPRQERTLRLELKLIADIGLIGVPNAGKSTLLSRVSKARPKIADYPFTTLEPNLGIAELSGYRRIVVADIPGLIEGASRGQGLGNRFLRHIERTRCLVHVLGINPLATSPGTPGTSDDPDAHDSGAGGNVVEALVRDYEMIMGELAGYSQKLADKPQIVALNKIDLIPDPQGLEVILDALEERLGVRAISISAVTGSGVTAVLNDGWELIQRCKSGSDAHDGTPEDTPDSTPE